MHEMPTPIVLLIVMAITMAIRAFAEIAGVWPGVAARAPARKPRGPCPPACSCFFHLGGGWVLTRHPQSTIVHDGRIVGVHLVIHREHPRARHAWPVLARTSRRSPAAYFVVN